MFKLHCRLSKTQRGSENIHIVVYNFSSLRPYRTAATLAVKLRAKHFRALILHARLFCCWCLIIDRSFFGGFCSHKPPLWTHALLLAAIGVPGNILSHQAFCTNQPSAANSSLLCQFTFFLFPKRSQISIRYRDMEKRDWKLAQPRFERGGVGP